jgi:hypothetical protein
MPKLDFIPNNDSDFLVWHDQFKTAVLAQAATFGLVAGDTTPITNDNTDFHTKMTNRINTGNIAVQAVADKTTSRGNAEKHARALAGRIKAHPNYTAALGNFIGIEGPTDTRTLTSAQPTLFATDQTHGVVQVDFDKSISDGVNIYSKRDGDAAFVFLARDTASPYVDNRALLVANKPELREYKAIYIQSDAEIGLFSAEVVVNCTP